MNPWNLFLQTVFQFVKSLFGGVTKKMHRNAAVLTMGATLIAVIPFTAVDFQGGGKNAIVAYAETQGGSDEDSLEETEDTALPETDGNVLEDETTADEASSAETEADIRTETENTETKEESITEPAAGSENADTDHGPEEAVETETAAAADEVSGQSRKQRCPGKPGYRRQQKRPSWQRNLQEKRSRGIPKATTMFFSGSFRRKPETATSKDVSWWQT